MGARREEAGREEGTLEAPGAPGGLQRPLDGQKLPEHTKTLIPDPRPQTSADMILGLTPHRRPLRGLLVGLSGASRQHF